MPGAKMESLYQLAKNKVREVYRWNWRETKCLPRTIKQDLLDDWLNGNVVDIECKRSRITASEWSSLLPMSTETFIDLMCHEEMVPSFASEENHIIYDYFFWENREGGKRLCNYCYAKRSKFFKSYSNNYWGVMGWKFSRVEIHEVIEGATILEDLIWNPSSWCEECISEPLFDIIDEYDCKGNYNYHSKYKCYDSSDDDDRENSYAYNKTRIVGNKIGKDLFSCLLKNKYFEW